MFNKIDPLPLDPGNLWAGDLFNRGEFANAFCPLLKKTATSTVIGISAPYGFGKTFFLQRLSEQIRKEGGWVVYVNAWEYDYFESPLLAVLDSLKTAAKITHDSKKIKKVLTDLGKAAAPALARAMARKGVESILGAEGSKELVDAAAEASGKTAETLMNRYMKEDTTHQTINILRNQISNFVTTSISDDAEYKNLIIIVDELDRARPNFSLRFLEIVKHVFPLNNVTFLFGCDKEVLVSSIRHEYGASLPADGYLRRLFDYWIELSSPDPRKYIVACIERYGLISDGVFSKDQYGLNGVKFYSDMMLLGHFGQDPSLRFIEQAVAHAGIFLKSTPSTRLHGLVGWLQGLQGSSDKLYEIYVSNDVISNVFQELKSNRSFIASDPHLRAWIILWAVNNKQRLRQDLANELFSDDQTLYKTIDDTAAHYHIAFDEPVSIACQTDKQLRTIGAQFR